MRIAMPNYPGELEVPDEWLTEAGLTGQPVAAEIFLCTKTCVEVPLRDIQPPPRNRECPLDFNGFGRKRLIYFLQCAAASKPIEPVPLRTLHSHGYLPTPFSYSVADGFHRFYAAIIVGHRFLPGIID